MVPIHATSQFYTTTDSITTAVVLLTSTPVTQNGKKPLAFLLVRKTNFMFIIEKKT